MYSYYKIVIVHVYQIYLTSVELTLTSVHMFLICQDALLFKSAGFDIVY